MPEEINDKYYAAIAVDWLRKCSENPLKAGNCNKCPFDDGEHNCMDHLHTTAADLLQKFAGLRK